MKNKIILVGHGGSGKDHLSNFLIREGYKKNVAYTTRPKREGEVDGVDYNFITTNDFEQKINEKFWHEYNIFIPEKRWYYGSSKYNFEKCQLFIKEPQGVSQLKKTERDKCLVVFININENIRKERMLSRKKNADSVQRRIESDRKDFKDFKDFDIEINDPNFDSVEVFKEIKKFLSL